MDELVMTTELREEALQHKEIGRFLLANSQRIKVNDNTTFLIKNKGAKYRKD